MGPGCITQEEIQAYQGIVTWINYTTVRPNLFLFIAFIILWDLYKVIVQNILKQRSQEKKNNEEELKLKAGLRATLYEQSLFSFISFENLQFIP